MGKVYTNVVGYEGLYCVSNDGDVKSVHAYLRKPTASVNTTLKQYKNRYGYMYVVLYKDGKRKIRTIHQLVAQAFIPNPENKPQVNHINGDKTDNRVENLEWVTASENKLHSYNVLKADHYKRKVMCVETGKVYDSLLEASKECNCSSKHIVDCCRGRRNTTGKYHWKYTDTR